MHLTKANKKQMDHPSSEAQNNMKRPDGGESSSKDDEQEKQVDAKRKSYDTKGDISNKKGKHERAISDDKLEERRQANRRSAMESRERKKQLLTDLQESVVELTEENKQLKAVAEAMRFELQTVTLENQQLRMIAAGQTFPQRLSLFPGVGSGGGWMMPQPNALPGAMNTPTGSASMPPGAVNTVTAPVPLSAGNTPTAGALNTGSMPQTPGPENQPVLGLIPFGTGNMSFAPGNLLPAAGIMPFTSGITTGPIQGTRSNPAQAGGESEVPRASPAETQEKKSEQTN